MLFWKQFDEALALIYFESQLNILRNNLISHGSYVLLDRENISVIYK